MFKCQAGVEVTYNPLIKFVLAIKTVRCIPRYLAEAGLRCSFPGKNW